VIDLIIGVKFCYTIMMLSCSHGFRQISHQHYSCTLLTLLMMFPTHHSSHHCCCYHPFGCFHCCCCSSWVTHLWGHTPGCADTFHFCMTNVWHEPLQMTVIMIHIPCTWYSIVLNPVRACHSHCHAHSLGYHKQP